MKWFWRKYIAAKVAATLLTRNDVSLDYPNGLHKVAKTAEDYAQATMHFTNALMKELYK